METLPTLRTNRTHLFPGARLEPQGHSVQPGDLVILFSDGACVHACLELRDDGFTLRVDEHRTAAGTSIGAKAWNIVQAENGSLRVRRRTS